jgi:hypothetical protein
MLISKKGFFFKCLALQKKARKRCEGLPGGRHSDFFSAARRVVYRR